MDADGQASAVERAVRDLRQEVDRVVKGSREEKLQNIASCERMVQNVRLAVDSYKLEISVLSGEKQAEHRRRLGDIEDGLSQCRTRIEWKRVDTRDPVPSAAAAAEDDENDGTVTAEQAALEADQIQDQSAASIARSKRMVLEAEILSIKTLGKLHEQDEQLDRIGEDVADVQANIVRGKKLVSQIARSAASDRCIQMLCVFITIAVIVMISLGITGRDGGQLNVPDQVRQK
eukprot:TRINITY_DN10894_c0_g1_i1.p1 TRINITY_DN10894_c0_g1~~TRINITY_DN10894_c0_g1_i1.p1  ORF type:complete len:232 (-),score=48.12 TRINITY_DN10894_c0_g1_i1:53-748(-)